MSSTAAVGFQSLEAGIYLVQTYDTKIVRNERVAYIVTALFKGEEIEFWADSTLTSYIKIKKPTEEFEIIVNRVEVSKEGLTIPYPNSVTIPGYLGKVTLTKKVL